MLEALLTASPTALSAENLLEQAWNENIGPFTNAVNITITRLRRKLGQPGLIQTTRGLGYRITDAPRRTAGSSTPQLDLVCRDPVPSRDLVRHR